MKKQQKNNGFTLIEVVVTVIVVTILFVGLTSAFLSVRKVNSVASQRDTGINIATSIIDGIKGTEFEALNYNDVIEANPGMSYEDFIKNRLVFLRSTLPSIYDSSSISLTYIEEDSKVYYILENIKGSSVKYKATLELFPSVDNNVNSYQMPILNSLNEDNTVVIDTSGNSWVYTDESNKDVEKESDNFGYKIDESASFDSLVLEEYMLKHESYIDSLYNKACDLITEHNNTNPTDLKDYPEFGVEPFMYSDEDTIKNLIRKETCLSIDDLGASSTVLCKINYMIDDSEKATYFGDISTDISFSIVDSTYTELDNIFYLHIPSEYKDEKVTVVNGKTVDTTKEFNLFFIVQNKYSKSYVDSILDNPSLLSDTYNSTNLSLDFNYSQGNPSLTPEGNYYCNLYTNCDQVTSSSIFSRVDTNYGYVLSNPSVRMYDAKITITDSNDEFLYTTFETKVLR